MSASVGIAMVRNGGSDDTEGLLHRADAAMYAAKRSDRAVEVARPRSPSPSGPSCTGTVGTPSACERRADLVGPRALVGTMSTAPPDPAEVATPPAFAAAATSPLVAGSRAPSRSRSAQRAPDCCPPAPRVRTPSASAADRAASTGPPRIGAPPGSAASRRCAEAAMEAPGGRRSVRVPGDHQIHPCGWLDHPHRWHRAAVGSERRSTSVGASWACTARSIHPAAMPSSSTSTCSARRASSVGARATSQRAISARRVAMTRADDPARPTERGMSVLQTTSKGSSGGRCVAADQRSVEGDDGGRHQALGPVVPEPGGVVDQVGHRGPARRSPSA